MMDDIFASKLNEEMFQILASTIGKNIYLQSTKIFKNAEVLLENNLGEIVYEKSMSKTNFLSIPLNYPRGVYLLSVQEGKNKWKRQIFI